MAVTESQSFYEAQLLNESQTLWVDIAERLALQHKYNRLASQFTEHLKHMSIPKLIVPTYLHALQNDYAFFSAEAARHEARQLHRDGTEALAFLHTRTQPMTDWTNYTTPELERLTTLTEATAKPGEFVRRIRTTTFRMRENKVTDVDGYTRLAGIANNCGPERRVTSFTDATELDPPQAEMLAELKRRTLRFRKGDTVVLACREEKRFGYIASVDADVPQSATHMRVTWDKRVDAAIRDGGATVAYYRLATPADIAAYEARIPKAPVFKAGDLAVRTGSNGNIRTGTLVEIIGDPRSAYFPGHVRGAYVTDGIEGIFAPSDLRPATDAEVAAYHRAHCQPKVEPKPAPKPASISNATHAGKKVRWFGGTIDYIVANMADGRIEAAPGIAVFLIEPSYGAIRYCYNAKELALSNGQ